VSAETRRVLILRNRRNRPPTHALDCSKRYIERFPEKYEELPASDFSNDYPACKICGGGRSVTPPRASVTRP
jgi:hypothetical protein